MEIKYIIIPLIIVIFSMLMSRKADNVIIDTKNIDSTEMQELDMKFEQDSAMIMEQIEYNNHQLKIEVDKLKLINNKKL